MRGVDFAVLDVPITFANNMPAGECFSVPERLPDVAAEILEPEVAEADGGICAGMHLQGDDALEVHRIQIVRRRHAVDPGPDRVAVALDPVLIPFSDFESLAGDRKSTRLNSSHSQISYAVFCLK